ncbi:MAG: C40 family peptidase [Candidatus Omnitrophica bacterium]|nr:C40 family peptidase [Candidatus Omnitrophota bacterium]
MTQLQPRRNINRILEDLPIDRIASMRDAEMLCDYVGRCTSPDVRLQVWDLNVESIDPFLVKGFASNPFALNALQKAAEAAGCSCDVSFVQTFSQADAFSFGRVVKTECPLFLTREKEERLDTAVQNDPLIVLRRVECRALVHAPNGYLGWVDNSDYRTISREEWTKIISRQNSIAFFGDLRKEMAGIAKRFLGAPYVWGGVDESGIDCSGFVGSVYRQIGVQLPRDADQQFAAGVICALPGIYDGFREGDLLFFSGDYGGVSHVGMALGPHEFIHARGENGVEITKMQEDEQLMKSFLLGKRILR